MDKILIIKIGALGDVVRTTSLLHALKGEVTWATKKPSFPLLAKNPLIHNTVDIAESYDDLLKQEYKLIINLEEEPQACELASRAKKSELVGAYSDNGKITYTDSAAPWFDMGLISRFGKAAADKKKWENTKSYQELMFAMIGKKFNGEEYILPVEPHSNEAGKEKVGLETRSGDRWVGKRWTRFPELIEKLSNEKIRCVKFKAFPTLSGFIKHINTTDIVVTTDSLALHLSLALKKRVIALFTCTSWHEIYGYGRTEKVVSPQIEKYFYNTAEEALKSGEAIQPETVYDAVSRTCMKLRSRPAGVPT